MGKNRDIWVEKVLASADELTTAPYPDLTNRILSRLQRPAVSILPDVWLWRVAASVLILMVLNLGSIYLRTKMSARPQAHGQMDRLAEEWGLEDEKIDF